MEMSVAKERGQDQRVQRVKEGEARMNSAMASNQQYSCIYFEKGENCVLLLLWLAKQHFHSYYSFLHTMRTLGLTWQRGEETTSCTPFRTTICSLHLAQSRRSILIEFIQTRQC